VERAVAFLDRLATARRPMTAAAVSTAAGVHRATGHALLQELATDGLVRRDEATKAYRLGPHLVPLGWATIEGFDGVAEARREMFGLARDLDAGCFVTVLVDWDMVILDRAGTEDPSLPLPATDALCVPVRPPFGAVFVAWSSPERIEEWLGLAGAELTPADREAHLRAVTAIRARGYSIGGEVEVVQQIEALLLRLRRSGDEVAAALELADLLRVHGSAADGGVANGGVANGGVADDRPIDYLLGPVFDATGKVALSLTVVGRPGQLTQGTVDRFVPPLLAATDRVTAAIGGRRPPGGDPGPT